MATKKIQPLQSASRGKAKIGKLRATSRDKTPRQKSARPPYAGWARFYKIIAVLGVIAVGMPYISLLFTWGARQYATVLSLAATIAMVSLGYGMQLLLLGKDRALLHASWDFSYESRPVRLPLWRVLPACVLSAASSALISLPVERLMVYLLRNEYHPGAAFNEEIGTPLLIVGFVVTAVGGCLLVPIRPHQLLSSRTFIEFLAILAFPLALSTFWGGGMNSPMIAVCLLVYMSCMSVVMNQEAIIRPAYGSSTCIATHTIRRMGLRSVTGFLIRTLLLTIPVLGTVTIFVTIFRALLTGGDFERTFQFPFEKLPVVNATLFTITFLLWAGAAIFYSVTRTPAQRAVIRKRLAAWWERLVDRFLTLLGIRDTYAAGQGQFEPVSRNFTDTVAHTERTADEPLTYRAFAKKVKSMNHVDERFTYAWRTMVMRLCAERRDLTPALTPLEMAAILSETTTVRDIDRLTAVFLEVTYAEGHDVHATEADVQAVMGILEEKW